MMWLFSFFFSSSCEPSITFFLVFFLSCFEEPSYFSQVCLITWFVRYFVYYGSVRFISLATARNKSWWTTRHSGQMKNPRKTPAETSQSKNKHLLLKLLIKRNKYSLTFFKRRLCKLTICKYKEEMMIVWSWLMNKVCLQWFGVPLVCPSKIPGQTEQCCPLHYVLVMEFVKKEFH